MIDKQKIKETFSQNLQYYLDRRGLTQTDLAKDLNIPETTMSNWLHAKTYPRMDKVQLIADYFDIKRSDLQEEKDDTIYDISGETRKIPVIGEVACGIPILVAENVEYYRTEFSDFLPKGNLVYVKAKGDSMVPTIPSGALVLIREQSDVESGEIAAVRIDGTSEVTLKRVKKQGRILLLVPENSAYDPIIVDELNPATIIGKAMRYTQDL